MTDVYVLPAYEEESPAIELFGLRHRLNSELLKNGYEKPFYDDKEFPHKCT
jgi:hypothetical protein